MIYEKKRIGNISKMNKKERKRRNTLMDLHMKAVSMGSSDTYTIYGATYLHQFGPSNKAASATAG